MQQTNEGTESFSLQRQQVVTMLGSRTLYEQVVKAGWLKPVIKTGRLTLFDRADVKAVWERVKREGVPSADTKEVVNG